MVFRSSRQRKAVMAKMRSQRPTFTAFSYKDGRQLKGKFTSLKDVFRKNPSEEKAFNKVKRFNTRTGSNLTTTKQIQIQKKRRSFA